MFEMDQFGDKIGLIVKIRILSFRENNKTNKIKRGKEKDRVS